MAAIALNVLAVPALFLRYGAERLGTAGAAVRPREPQPVLEGVG